MGSSAFSSSSPESRGTPLPLAPALPAVRLSADRLIAVRDALSPRDQAVVDSLEQHPFLTGLQLQRLHFRGHATLDAAGRVCRRVLRRLAGLRIIEHLERRVGGIRAGSASYVWRLGPIGDRLLRLRDGHPGHARRKEPSLRYLQHALAVAEVHIRLLEAGQDGDLGLDVLRVDPEPTCWRPYTGLGGGRSVLKPDLYAVTAIRDYEDHWFVEVDRGTESLPTLLHKCSQYEAYRRTGQEQTRAGVFPLVLWLLPDVTRTERLQASIDTSRHHDRALYRLAPFADLERVIREPAS